MRFGIGMRGALRQPGAYTQGGAVEPWRLHCLLAVRGGGGGEGGGSQADGSAPPARVGARPGCPSAFAAVSGRAAVFVVSLGFTFTSLATT